MPQNRGKSSHAAGNGRPPGSHPFAALGACIRATFDSLVRRFASSHEHKALEVRDLEAHFARAADHRDLQWMEYDWSHRDGGGMRAW